MPGSKGDSLRLGIDQLDEPTIDAMDPTLLECQLRRHTKGFDAKPWTVHSLPPSKTQGKAIDAFLRDVEKRGDGGERVVYSTVMPDVEELMETWPVSLEEHLILVR